MPVCRLPLIFLLLFLSVVPALADDVTARVIVLANSDDPDSVKLAAYYAEKRGVPAENIITFPMPITETISWKTFVETLFNPLQAELVKRGWIDAMGMDLQDDAGRKKYVMSGHKISYLTVCRGVPLKIAHDAQIPAEATPAAGLSQFKTNAAAVDAELALIALSNPPTVAFLPNPLFKNDQPSTIQLNQIVKVGRLDGPSFDDARGLIDKAIEAETTGLIGRGYIDIGGPHPQGDRWLEDAAKQLDALGFDNDVDRAGGTMPAWARFDAPALYFGWYAGTINGPFAAADFKFPVGAVALHIHSFSASTVRSATQGWVGPLIAHGVTATFGNVNEPYLEFTHQPQLVLKSLARGDRLGDAAAYSIPAYSWQGVLLGDPLYRPFKVTFAEQWARRATLPAEQRAQVVVRRMHEQAKAGDRNGAIWTGLIAEKTAPSLAVELAVAQLQQAMGDGSGAGVTLGRVAERRRFTLAEAPLAAGVARILKETGDAKAAVRVWQQVLGGLVLEKGARLEWLPQALEAGKAAKDARQVLLWDAEYKELTAPPPAEKAEAAKTTDAGGTAKAADAGKK